MVGLVRPHHLVHRNIAAAGELRELAAAGVPQCVNEEQAVLGRRPTDAEHEPGPCVAVDVRHAERPVAHDRHPRLRLWVLATFPAGTPKVASLKKSSICDD